MPEIDEKAPFNAAHQEAPSSLFLDAYNFCKDTVNHPEARLRQAEVISLGTITGCIQEGRQEIINHPFEVAGKVAVASETGAALGAALAVESPIIAGGALGLGVIGTGSSLWHTYSNIIGNKNFQNSMDAAFKSRDQNTLDANIRTASNVLGPEAFNYAIVSAAGLGSLFRPKLATTISTIPWVSKLSEYLPLSKLGFKTNETYAQYIPMPKATGGNTVEMYFKHDVTLHAHISSNSAMLRAGGVEYVVNTNKNGIDLASFVSDSGKQIIKGQSQEKLPLEVSINPETGITKIKGYGKTWEYQYSEKNRIKNPNAYEWLSCRRCNPFEKPKGYFFK